VSIAYDPHTIDIAVLAFYGPRLAEVVDRSSRRSEH